MSVNGEPKKKQTQHADDEGKGEEKERKEKKNAAVVWCFGTVWFRARLIVRDVFNLRSFVHWCYNFFFRHD